MGVTVRQKRKGRGNPWYVFVHRGSTIRSKKVGDKRMAQAVAAKLRKKLAVGELGLDEAPSKDPCPTFSEYTKRYLNDYVRQALKYSTRCGYEKILENHLVPAFGTKRLTDITREDIKRFLARKRREITNRKRPVSAGTLSNIRNVLSGIYSLAVEDDLVDANPARNLGKFIRKSRDRKAHIRALTGEQVRAVLTAAQEVHPEHNALLMCGFRTGMRLGELLGLAWEDVDFAGKGIVVRRGWCYGRFSTPKTHKSRYVDVSDQLARTLFAHRSDLLRRFGRLPEVPVPPGMAEGATLQLVFPSQGGRQLNGRWLRQKPWRMIFEAANVPEIRIHDMRHTYASLLLQQGESLHYVKEQLGHASIQTTVDVYGHMAPGSNRNAVNKLDDATLPSTGVAVAG